MKVNRIYVGTSPASYPLLECKADEIIKSKINEELNSSFGLSPGLLVSNNDIVGIVKPYEGVRCINCKYAVRNKEGELNPRDIVCSMWCTDGFDMTDYCSRGEPGIYVPDDNCIQDQEGYI